MECLICLFVILVYDLITVHALERAIGVDAELILAFALFPHLALVNVLENFFLTQQYTIMVAGSPRIGVVSWVRFPG